MFLFDRLTCRYQIFFMTFVSDAYSATIVHMKNSLLGKTISDQ